MSPELQLANIVNDIIAHGAPSSALTDDKYDQSLSEVIRRISDEKHGPKMQWILMRIGLRTMMNELYSRGRLRLKMSSQQAHSVEKLARKNSLNKEYREKSKRDKVEREEYARAHNISVEQVSDHKIASCFKKAEQRINDAVHARAIEIVTTWICDGGAKLQDCNKGDLVRMGNKELDIAAGHTRTGTFYLSLAEYVPNGKTVEKVDPAAVVRCFNEAFSDPVTRQTLEGVQAA